MPRVTSLVTLCVYSFGVVSCAVRIGAAEPGPSPVVPAPQARSGPAPTQVARAPARVVLRKKWLPHAAPETQTQQTQTQTQTQAPPANDSSIAQLCVDEINRYRGTLGLRALRREAQGEACADGQIRDDAQAGKWHGSYGRCKESLQNECMSSPTGETDFIKGCLRGMWNEGPGGGHYEAMKNPTVTKVWCGFYTTPSGDRWSVQDFR
jgi:hypothetical protein